MRLPASGCGLCKRDSPGKRLRLSWYRYLVNWPNERELWEWPREERLFLCSLLVRINIVNLIYLWSCERFSLIQNNIRFLNRCYRMLCIYFQNTDRKNNRNHSKSNRYITFKPYRYKKILGNPIYSQFPHTISCAS